ncbi:MAG: aldehyde-activating protein [Alphaproteobacteria bacterium]|jgi:hypothetical protein|nr:aldehyde-activating protein [Alphaproteobacteria bacterium]MDP6568101.1 aldehyde-activating protein [Alphaproteobacteria bacterium]MDP6813816.1 aldehyde-activating protein [Alphaproteobacteria bacterium]
MLEFHGSCHCGNLEIDYRSTAAAEDSAVRACQCSFCRKHDARAVSDPAGSIAITVHDPDLLQRYRFGFGATDFLICRRCGVYVSAYMPDGKDAYANAMVNALDDRRRFPPPGPVALDGEDEAHKRQRRRENWTPAKLHIGNR